MRMGVNMQRYATGCWSLLSHDMELPGSCLDGAVSNRREDLLLPKGRRRHTWTLDKDTAISFNVNRQDFDIRCIPLIANSGIQRISNRIATMVVSLSTLIC